MKGTENFAGQDAKLEIERKTTSKSNLTKTSFLYDVGAACSKILSPGI